MAYHRQYYQVDYLRDVALDGFELLEKQYGRRNPPPPVASAHRIRQDHHKLAPNQYDTMPYPYQEPDQTEFAASIDQPSFRSYYLPPLATSKQQRYETWYFLPVPQAPMKGGISAISSSKAAEQYGGILFTDYGYGHKNTKSTHRP